MIVRIVLALAACAACSSPGAHGERPTGGQGEPAGGDAAAKTSQVDAAMTVKPVDMKFVGMEPGRPPLMRLRFDVILHNPAAQPRWFLLPREFDHPAVSGGGVDGVEVAALSGQGRVLLGHFQGTGGTQAVLVPGGATVTMRRLEVLGFDIPDGPASLEVVVAHDLTVGGEPAATWFPADPTAPAGAQVSQDQATAAGSRHTDDRREVPLAFVEDSRVKIDFNVTAAPIH